VSIPGHDWDRHHYEAMLPGFGGSDSMDWRGFVDLLQERGFKGPFEIENEAKNSKDTGDFSATVQGFTTCLNFLAPMLWDLEAEVGYAYKKSEPLKDINAKDIPVITMDDLI